MRRDSIFYQLFQQSPMLLFDLLDNPPANAANYRFDSVAVKEPTFSIDGVFLPPQEPGIVYFCEVQFQRDETLYERLFGESFLYFYRNRDRFSDWQAVIIYPSQATEQKNSHPYRALLHSDQVHRIYLDSLGDIQALPIGVALMVLTTLSEREAPSQARNLLNKIQQQELTPQRRQAIIETVSTIMVYKFTTLSRTEVEAMLGLSLQETRVYQEAKAEGEELGRQEGLEEGRRQERKSLVLVLLNQKFAPLDESLGQCIEALSLKQLEEALAIALDQTTELETVEVWVQKAIAHNLTEQLTEQFGNLPPTLDEQIKIASLAQLSALSQSNLDTLETVKTLLIHGE